MQMIDVLKRLAELDAQNPNLIKESETVEECGIMPAQSAMGMSSPHTPASINITADSGQELSDMLRDIMSLAGMHHHDHDHDHEMPDAPMSSPVGALDIDTTRGDDMPGQLDSVDSMRSMIDKLNPDGEEPEDDEDKVKEYDSTPNPEMTGQPPANQDQSGTPGGGDGRNTTMQPQATPAETYENLMKEYQKFLQEGSK